MSENTANDRLALKTPEASFLHVLEHEFDLSYRAARAVVSIAQEYLGGGSAPNKRMPNCEGIAMVSHDS